MHLLQTLDTHRSQVEAAYMEALVASEGEFARLEARGLGALQMLQQTQAELAQARAALGQTQAQVTREREERRKDSEKLKAEAIVQAKAEMKAERDREKEKEREEREAAVAQRDEARREKDDACVRAAKEQSEKEVAMSMNTLLRRRTQELGREVERLNKEIALLGMPGQHPGLIQQLQHDDKRGVLMHEVAVEEDRKEVDLKAPSKLVTAELLEEWRITVTKDWEERMLAGLTDFLLLFQI
jgi:TATA-binding protein-associated factor Taf7